MQTTIPIGKLIKKTLVEQAVEQVQAYILVQKLTPGDVLPSEMRFTEILGVSRPVVREALRTLAGRGVLTIANGRNAVVSPVSATMLIQFFERATQLNGVAVVELLEVRLGIEVQSAMLAASRRTASDITALRDAIDQLTQSRNDIDAYSKLDAALHLRIAAASKNEMLQYFVESLSGGLQMASLVGLQHRRTRAELDEVHTDHCELVDAIVSGNGDVARMHMERHVNSAILAMRRDPEYSDDKVQ